MANINNEFAIAPRSTAFTNSAATPAPQFTAPQMKGTSQTIPQVQTIQPPQYDYNTGKLLAPGQAQSLYNTMTGQKIGSTLQSTPVPATPTAGDLANTTPLNVPATPTTSNAYTGLTGYLDSLHTAPAGSVLDAQGNATIPPSPEAPTGQKGLIASMKGMLTSPLDRATERSKLENEAALSQQQQDKANDYNKYNKAKTSFQQQELAFEQMNTGGRQAGHEVELSRMRRDNALALAELRANAEFSAGNYKDAVETIDKKVQLMFDDQKQAVDNNFRWLEANQNDLTDSEAKQIDTVNRQKEEQIKEKMDATKVVSKILMENNAPAEIRAALTKVAQDPKSSVSDIYGAAGKYGVDAYKQAQINSLNAAAEKARRVDTSGGMGGVGGAYTNDLDAMMGLVKSTIPTKFGQQTFQNQLNKARNDGDRISLMAGQVLKSYPAEIKRDFVNQVSGLAMIDKAIAEVDNDAKTGVINNALQYTYNVFGKDYDPKLQKINSYITSAIQPYRNSVTGAAWSEQEDSEYANLFGSTKYSPVELRQRLVQVREMLKSKSAQGLNAYTNPLGYYDNPYQSGQFAPGEGTPSGQTQIPFAPGQSGGSSDDALLSNYGL